MTFNDLWQIYIYIMYIRTYLPVLVHKGLIMLIRYSKFIYFYNKYTLYIYRVSQEECARLRESVPYVNVYRYNPKHLCPKLNGYVDNGQRSFKL